MYFNKYYFQNKLMTFNPIVVSVLLLTVFHQIRSLHNPGLLISIPENFNLPQIPIPTPQNFENIIVQELEITNVVLQRLQYYWTFKYSVLQFYKTRTLISFDWKYRKDNGKGTFTEQNVQLDLGISLKKNPKNNRLQVQMDSIKKKGGHTSIHLGGGIPQTIVVEVTNLILNRGAVLFWRFIQKALKNQINKAIEPLTEKDIQIYCNKNSSQSCEMLSTILVADPLVYNHHTILQINGFPYSSKQTSTYLDAASVMTYSNSSKLQMQVHQDLFNKFVSDILRQQNYNFEFDSMGVSGITEINTLVLTNVFPQMIMYQNNPKNVIFDITVRQAVIKLYKSQGAKITADGKFQVYTQPISSEFGNIKTKQLYMNPGSGTVQIDMTPYFGKNAINANINKIQLKQIKPDEQDIYSGKVILEPLYRDVTVFFQMAKSAINGQLYKNIITQEYQGISFHLEGAIKDRSILVQANF